MGSLVLYVTCGRIDKVGRGSEVTEGQPKASAKKRKKYNMEGLRNHSIVN